MSSATQARNGQPSLQQQLSTVEAEFGKGTVMRLGDRRPQLDVSAISTGALSLDLALGIGGVPRGRIVEIYGPESSGKTTLVYHIIAQAQRAGGRCLFIDAEHAMDPKYAKRIGVDTDALLVSQPDYGEQALRVADTLIRSGELAVVCVDSVAALTPKAEIEGQIGDQVVGLMARMMSQAMRVLAGSLNRTGTLCVFTNQLREKIGNVGYGSPETTPGGRALRFYASQRLDIRRIETIKDGTESVANRVRVKVVKNKMAAPFRQAELEIEFGTGISTFGSVLDVGTACGVVVRSGAFYAYGDERLGQGRTNAKAYLAEHPETAAAITAGVYRAAGISAKDAAPAPRTEARTPDGAGQSGAQAQPSAPGKPAEPDAPDEPDGPGEPESNGQSGGGTAVLDEVTRRLQSL